MVMQLSLVTMSPDDEDHYIQQAVVFIEDAIQVKVQLLPYLFLFW